MLKLRYEFEYIMNLCNTESNAKQKVNKKSFFFSTIYKYKLLSKLK